MEVQGISALSEIGTLSVALSQVCLVLTPPQLMREGVGALINYASPLGEMFKGDSYLYFQLVPLVQCCFLSYLIIMSSSLIITIKFTP